MYVYMIHTIIYVKFHCGGERAVPDFDGYLKGEWMVAFGTVQVRLYT